MTRKTPPQGLRVTVRKGGDVVDQDTRWLWDGWGLAWTAAVILVVVTGVQGAVFVFRDDAFDGLAALLTGMTAVAAASPFLLLWGALRRVGSSRGTVEGGAILTEDGGPLADFTFTSRRSVALVPRGGAGAPVELGPGQSWTWRGPHDTTVDLDLVPLQRATRWGGAQGDIAFLTTVLMLAVGLAQIAFLKEQLLSPGAMTAQSTTPEPTPEYIARLLQRDLDGADEGMEERVDRLEQVEGNQSFYMPSGNQGPTTRAGGGAHAGDAVQRREAEEVEDDPPLADAAQPDEDEALEGEVQPPERTEDEAQPVERDLLGEAARDELEPAESAEPTPMERFVGWGFRDWLEVRDARPEAERQIARHLELMRHRLRIDPNDPGALNVLGYYAYLSENADLSRETYARYVELYPEDALGYNNLALTYKRTGDYDKEEALYRKALAMDPLDHHVLNNLAVNLAHQGRYDEALSVMEQLEELTPGDPYADLHRAKIYASMGKRNKALRHLEVALDNVAELDTLHHIEFRQDLRLDPAFAPLRSQARFRRILERHYGSEAEHLLAGPDRRHPGGPHG